MTRGPSFKGFSLVELLVALSCLAVVAAVIMPKFLGVQSQAMVAVSQQNQREFQLAVQKWVALGGTGLNSNYGVWPHLANDTSPGAYNDSSNAYGLLSLLSMSSASRPSSVQIQQYSSDGSTAQVCNVCDSAGPINSSLVSLSFQLQSLSTRTSITGNSPSGFYYTGRSTGSYYSDGAGNLYPIYVSSGGDVQFGPTVPSASAATYGSPGH